MNFKLTQEQEDIVKTAIEVDKLKIDAAAGASKTTTLTLVANAIPKPSLYIAFNKAIAEEASSKFPSHVECRTTHSLAYSSFGRKIAHKLCRPSGKYVNVAQTSREIARYYDIKSEPCHYDSKKQITPIQLALIIKETVNRFETSSDQKINKDNVPYGLVSKVVRDKSQRREIANTVLSYAKKLWADRSNKFSEVLATHNTYLKMYQLSKPELPYSVIYLDEAQDSSDVVLDIFLNQKNAKLIAVGDTYQAIYGWNGAVNAMSKLNFPRKCLSKSFRFGQPIADVAKKIIKEGIDIKGFEKVESQVGFVDTEQPYTKIFRTNSALLEDAVNLISLGKDISIEIDVKGFIKFLECSLALFENRKSDIKNETVLLFDSWKDFSEYKNEDAEVKRVVGIVESGKTQHYIDCLNKISNKKDADIILTTCHKSKGREWDNVVLADDFVPIRANYPQEETNLLYVAVTRAMKVLEINSVVSNILARGYVQEDDEEYDED